MSSLSLPNPPQRSTEKHICIEHLYPDAVLQKRDSNDRRLYLRNEFNPATSVHRTEPVFCQNIQTRTLVAENVIDFASQARVSLTKQAFADAITTGLPPFADVDFEGFAPVFDVFLAIRTQWLSKS
jgi:hypothetical protein